MTNLQLIQRAIERGFDEARSPVVWCHGCLYARVRFDWRNERQLCPECEAGAQPEPSAMFTG